MYPAALLPLASQTTYFLLTKENIPDLCLNVWLKLSGLAVRSHSLLVTSYFVCGVTLQPGQ